MAVFIHASVSVGGMGFQGLKLECSTRKGQERHRLPRSAVWEAPALAVSSLAGERETARRDLLIDHHRSLRASTEPEAPSLEIQYPAVNPHLIRSQKYSQLQNLAALRNPDIATSTLPLGHRGHILKG